MKNLMTICILVIFCFNSNAQRTIEKNIDYKNQVINIKVSFASEISLKTWDKPNVYVKANLTTEEGKYLDLYALNIEENNNDINIIENAEPLLRKWQKDLKEIEQTEEIYSDGKVIFKGDNIMISEGMKYKLDYTIYIPEGAEFKLSSINGNLTSEIINGNFKANLINGNIDIKKYKGKLHLSTINGEISIALNDSGLKASTMRGNIYADEDLKFDSARTMVGQNLVRKKGSGVSQLQLNTINGNMYLKK